MNLLQFLLILRARWLSAVLTFVVVVVGTIGVSLLLPRKYAATTELLLDVKSPDPVAGMVLPGLVLPAYMATQVDIINSDSVAMRVVKLLHLDENAAMRAAWQKDTEGRGNYENWAGRRLQTALDAKPSRESNVISINYKGADPDFAAAVANAFAQAYIDQNLAMSVEPARQYNAWFQARLAELHQNLVDAQKRLSEYQARSGIVIQDDRVDAENQKLNDLQSQYVLAVAQEADATGKQGSNGGDTLPDVMQNNVIISLKADIARSEGKLQDMAGNLGRNHPQFQRAQSELDELKRHLADETSRVRHSIDTQSRIGLAKTGDIHARIEESKRRILALKKARGEVDVLRQEAETATRAYDTLAQRQAANNLTSQNTQTNVVVLSPAIAPSEPASPRIMLNALLATFGGVILGMVAAFLRELADRRVRLRDELEGALGFPVLAELRG